MGIYLRERERFLTNAVSNPVECTFVSVNVVDIKGRNCSASWRVWWSSGFYAKRFWAIFCDSNHFPLSFIKEKWPLSCSQQATTSLATVWLVDVGALSHPVNVLTTRFQSILVSCNQLGQREIFFKAHWAAYRAVPNAFLSMRPRLLIPTPRITESWQLSPTQR